MKYGQLLRRYSVPEWHAHNILYDILKQDIKNLTATRESFNDEHYSQLVTSFSEEIDNANLFVRCKLGEIEFRLQQCDTLVRDLASRMDERRVWKLNQEVRKLASDIQNLSRFIEAQFTGFRKLLKKFRRHAPSDKLDAGQDLRQIDDKLLERGSFATVDLTPQFLELGALYSTIRTRKFEELNQSLSLGNKGIYNKGSSSWTESDPSGPTSATEQALKFDVEMLTAHVRDVHRFWVHADYLVQLKILLLEKMDLVGLKTQDINETEVTKVQYLDTPDLQAARHFSEPAQIRQVGKDSEHVLLVPSVGLRHTAATALSPEQEQRVLAGDVDKKDLDTETHVSSQLAMGWIASQNVVHALDVSTRRTRFRNSDDKIWAAVDNDIQVINSSARFPFAVLELRVGNDVDWLNSIRNSHLVHPVSGSFSIYLWALIRRKPRLVTTRPGWLDDLDSGKNIKREPEDAVVTTVQKKPLKSSKSYASIKFGIDDRRYLEGDESRDAESTADNDGTGNTNTEGSRGTTVGNLSDGPRYWNEFDDGDEYNEGDDHYFYDDEDETLRRARVAERITTPVYQLGETMRRRFNFIFDRLGPMSSSDSDIDNLSVNSVTTDDSSVHRVPFEPQYSPRNRHHNYGATDDVSFFDLKTDAQRRRNDHGLKLITFLCFMISNIVVLLVFILFFIEEVEILPVEMRLALILFLGVALVFSVAGYIAFQFRNESSWKEQVAVNMGLLTVVCFAVGGMANLSLPST